jgi:galacturonosyltransferase
MYRIGLKKATCVFFQNESNKDFFMKKKIVYSNYRVVPGSGVNLTDFAYQEYSNEGKIRLLFIGRLMKDKGIIELFETAKYYKDKQSNIEFHIIGFSEAEFDTELKELIANDTIHFYGQLSDVREHIKLCHAIILPSYHEGISNVLLEAASIGRPILASNIPGCKETFDEGISGIGFEPKNVSSMIEAIDKFINLSYEMKRKMGYNARRKVELSFDRKIVIDAYLEEISKFKEL